MRNAAETGAYLGATMREALGDHHNVGEIPGEGMLCAVELVAERDGRQFFSPADGIGAKVVAAMLRRGVIGRAMPQGDILGFAPPLCLTPKEAETVVAATLKAVKRVLG